jgi:hypothetical protein
MKRLAFAYLLAACRPSAAPAVAPAPERATKPVLGTAGPIAERMPLQSPVVPASVAPELRAIVYDGAEATGFPGPRNEPLVVVFADGRVLGRSPGAGPPAWRQRELSTAQLDALVADLDVDALAELPPVVSCRPGWWFQPITRIAVRTADGWLVRQLLGREACEQIAAARRAGDPRPHDRVVDEMHRGDAVHWPWDFEETPPVFAAAFARLQQPLADAKPWRPDGFVVEMHRQVGGVDELVEWPKGVPAPPLLGAIVTDHDQRVDGRHYAAFGVFEQEHAPLLHFDERRWYVLIHRDVLGGDLGPLVEAADAVGCAHEARQRLRCVEGLTLAPPVKPGCLAAIEAAADPSTCQAERLRWMNDCSSSVFARCGF